MIPIRIKSFRLTEPSWNQYKSHPAFTAPKWAYYVHYGPLYSAYAQLYVNDKLCALREVIFQISL